jgi:hypothetical protein
VASGNKYEVQQKIYLRKEPMLEPSFQKNNPSVLFYSQLTIKAEHTQRSHTAVANSS